MTAVTRSYSSNNVGEPDDGRTDSIDNIYTVHYVPNEDSDLHNPSFYDEQETTTGPEMLDVPEGRSIPMDAGESEVGFNLTSLELERNPRDNDGSRSKVDSLEGPYTRLQA